MAASEGIFNHILNCRMFHLGVLMDLGGGKGSCDSIYICFSVILRDVILFLEECVLWHGEFINL